MANNETPGGGDDEASFAGLLDGEPKPLVRAPAGGESPYAKILREALELAQRSALPPGEKPAAPPEGGPSLREPKGPTLTQALRLLVDDSKEAPFKK